MDTLRGLLLLVSITGAVQAGQVYRWTDEQGHVHFGDRPQANAEPVQIRSSGSSDASPDQQQRQDKTRRLLNAWEEERRLKAEQQAQAKTEQEGRQRRCIKARHELQDLENGGLFYELDEQGERRFWSEDQVQENKRRWREEVARWCDS